MSTSRGLLVEALALSFRLVKGLMLVLLVLFFVKPGPDQGFFIVEPDEVAFILRFGRVVGEGAASRVHGPGWHYAWPRPVDEIRRVKIRQVIEVDLDDFWRPKELAAEEDGEKEDGAEGGYVPLANRMSYRAWRARSKLSIDPTNEGYLITGDRNVVQTRAVLKFQIVDAEAWCFAAADRGAVLRALGYSELVRAAGREGVDSILAEGKARLAEAVRAGVQAKAEALGLGVEVVAVEFKEIVPNRHVMKEFQAVVSAYIEKETKIKEAMSYEKSEIPRAQSEANRILSAARAAARETMARAEGETARFESVLAEYRKDPRSMRDRLYRATMEDVFHLMGGRVALDVTGEDRLKIFLSPEGR